MGYTILLMLAHIAPFMVVITIVIPIAFMAYTRLLMLALIAPFMVDITIKELLQTLNILIINIAIKP